MPSKTLCKLARTAVIAVAMCGLAVCGYVLPVLGGNIARNNPALAYCYIPWLTFLWIAALPCFAILALIWKVSTAISREQVFTHTTAHLVKAGAVLLFCDVGLFFAGNVLFLFMNMSHPAVLLLSIFVDVFGLSLAVLAAILSRYLTKAADLQEEVDGTI